MFGSDQVLLYNVEPWSRLGFGVPSFGDDTHTLNTAAHRLADEIGQLQLFVMTHIDATRRRPPSRNTIERLAKMMNRVFSVLEGRMKDYPDMRVEPGHGQPSAKPWLIHPCPYFPGPIVRNGWLSEYNELTMLALANIYQHSDNNLSRTVTKEFAGDVAQYFGEIRYLVGRELLGIPQDQLQQPDFVFAPDHYTSYHPDQVTVRIEALDTPGNITARFTEDDLQPLLTGIPANMIIPNLAKYPVGPITGWPGAPGDPLPAEDAAPGTDDGSAIEPVI